jgi:ATP-binding cassette, subfamily B, bacterial PglK
MTPKIILNFLGILSRLDNENRKRIHLQIILSIFGAIADLMSVLSITFLMTFFTTSKIDNDVDQSITFGIFKSFNIINENFAVMIATFIISVSILIRYAVLIHGIKVGNLIDYDLSKKLLKIFIDSPYEIQKLRSLADSNVKLTSEVGRFVQGVVLPGINIPYLVFSTVIITLFGFWAVGWVYIFIVLLFFSILILFFLIKRNLLINTGNFRLSQNEARYNIFTDTINGIVEITVYGLKSQYLKKYSNAHKNIVLSEVKSNKISLLPKFVVEIIFYAVIGCSVLYIINSSYQSEYFLENFLVILASFIRLAPNVNSLYGTSSVIVYNKSNINSLSEQYSKLDDEDRKETLKIYQSNKNENIKQIDIRNISFKYKGTKRQILDNISMKLSFGQLVAIRGETGSGKSTFVEVLLGLLTPTEGINELYSLKSEKKISVGYVPQYPVFPNCNIIEAISLSKKVTKSQKVRINQLLTDLHLLSAIEDLPDGFDTILSNNANVLSGGQRQRLAIAKALFLDSDVIIFDECTSALNVEIEKVVFRLIQSCSAQRIMIFSTHSQYIIDNCDDNYHIKNGKLI